MDKRPIISDEELDAARDRVLMAQRKCSWCDERFTNAQQLADHIQETHMVDRMTGAEFRAKLAERFPIRDTDVHEAIYWWGLLQEFAQNEFNRAYRAHNKKGQ